LIDWLDIVVSVPHKPIPAGCLMAIDPDGEIEYEIVKSVGVPGSYDSTIRAKSQGSHEAGIAGELYITGNPAKFIQGHNVFGTDDINSLVLETCKRLFAALNIQNDIALASIGNGQFEVKRIDINYSYQFKSRSEVLAVLAFLATNSRSRRGRAQCRGGTVYHGLGSRRHLIKYYCKGEELQARGKGHKLPDQLFHSPLTKHADTLLRTEVQLRSLELKERNLTQGTDLNPKVIKALYTEYSGRIDMPAKAQIASHEIESLSRHHRSTYLLWRSGVDVRTMMSESTFYRHRFEILKSGVDIAIPCNSVKAEVIPLFREVVGTPVGIPDWAYRQELVFDPNKIGG